MRVDVLQSGAGVTLNRATRVGIATPSGEILCRHNARFLLGVLRVLGYSAHFLSLHLLAVEDVVRRIAQILERRGVKGGRKYQLFMEMRTVMWWIADTTHPSGVTTAVYLEQTFPAFAIIEVILRSSSFSRILFLFSVLCMRQHTGAFARSKSGASSRRSRIAGTRH
jgi:hypothetical protein